MDFSAVTVPEAVIALIPKRLVYEYSMMPLLKQGENFLVAISDPQDVRPESELRKILGCQIRSAIADPDDLRNAILKYYGPKAF